MVSPTPTPALTLTLTPTPSWILIASLTSYVSSTLAVNSVPATISPSGELYDSIALDEFYVDKTLMIEEFFTCFPENEFHLIAQPPKYGKSTVLKMIKRFVEVELDDKGYVPREKNCTTSQILFERFKIGLNTEIMERHLAQYPVIYVDFDFEDCGLLPSKERALRSLKEKISVCYKRYYWLYEHLLKTHPYVDLDSVDFMRKAMDGSLSQYELAHSLRKLAELLHSHFREKVVVLIDDYDKSVLNATFKPASWNTYAFNALRLSDLILRIIYNVLYAGRSHVRHALITGVSTMAAESVGGGGLNLDTVARWSFLDGHQFDQYYGFTQLEVNQLLDKYLIEEQERSLVRIYYDGFRTVAAAAAAAAAPPPHATRTCTRIYRPASIVRYLRAKLGDSRTALLRSYWNETEISSFRVQFLNNHRLRQKLITNMANRSAGIILAAPFRHLRSSQSPILDLMHLACQKFRNFTVDQTAAVARYLFETGFLYYDSKSNLFYVANQEAEQICVRKITQYYREIAQIDNFHSLGGYLVNILNNMTNAHRYALQQFQTEAQNAFRKHLQRRPDLTSTMDIECQTMVFMMAKAQPDVIVKGKITGQTDSIITVLINSRNQGLIVRTLYKANLTHATKQFVHYNPQMKKILTIYVDEKLQVRLDLQNVQRKQSKI